MKKYKLPFNTAGGINFTAREKTKDQLNIILDILKAARNKDKFIFLKGGWNIDLSFGRPTRNHHDIDFHYERKDKKFWKQWFSQRGYKIEEKDDWSMVCTLNDVLVDFEAFELISDELRWKYGNTSKLVEVVEDSKYEGIGFKKMNLGVEKYLRGKRTNLRKKDVHDLAVISLVENRGGF